MRLFGGETDVLFASHHWPRWGRDRAEAFLKVQRDLYKYIHDQSLRLANHGLNAAEIAEELALPPTLAAEWHTRDYYGTLNHNAKAVYQRYLGWFDGNPANLHKHPPVEAGRRYVELAGGPRPCSPTLGRPSRRATIAGSPSWSTISCSPIRPTPSARALQADTLEQMGYQAESGPWRAFYLTGAKELRYPRPAAPAPRQAGAGQLRALPADNLLDSLSVRLNGDRAGEDRLEVNLTFSDTGETFGLRMENAVLRHGRAPIPGAACVTLTRSVLIELVLGERSFDDTAQDGSARVEGDADPLRNLLALLDRFDFWFEIVTP